MGGTFTKVTGAGNDFIVLNLLDSKVRDQWKKAGSQNFENLAVQLCDRHFSVGADGFFVLLPPIDPNHQFRWEFFNSDGSRAEMCGNAARCAALVYSLFGNGDQANFIFENGNEAVRCRWIETLIPKVSARIGVSLSHDPKILRSGVFLGTEGQLVLAGVPHFCVAVKEKIEFPNFREISSDLRHFNDFGAKGANVSYYWVEAPNRIGAVTFERGVEDFTLACGTGAMAVALAYSQTLGLSAPWQMTVNMPGGPLVVSKNNDGFELQGEAKLIAHFDPCL